MSSRFPREVSLGFLATALAYSVFSYGGVVRVHWNACMLLVGLSALIQWRRRPSSSPDAFHFSYAWWLVLLSCYVLGQLIPMPLGLLRVISPSRAELLDNVGHVSDSVNFAPVSINPPVTWEHLVRIGGYTVIFLLIREISTNLGRRMWMPVLPIVVVAGLEAALRIAQYDFSPLRVDRGTYVPTFAHGTYINKNNFAALLEMALPFVVVWAAQVFVTRSGSRRRFGPAVLACLPLALSGLILVSIYCADSRSALISCAGSLGFMAILWKWAGLPVRMTLQAIVVSAIVISGAAALVLLTLSRPVPLSLAAIYAESRWLTWRDTLHLVTDYPVVGCGLGAYASAFVKYQTHDLMFAISHADNDYLQLLVELGGFGVLIPVVLTFTVLLNTVRSIKLATGLGKYVGLACVGSITALLIHSLVECNVCIPANVLVCAWILGIATSLWDPSSKCSSGKKRLPPGFARNCSILLSCSLIIYAGTVIMFDSGLKDRLQVERILCHIGVCNTTGILAHAQVLIASGDSGIVQAINIYEEALRRDAASPDRWTDLGQAFLVSAQVEKARYSFSRALELGPNIPPVQLKVANFHFNLHEDRAGLRYTSRILSETSVYDNALFNSYHDMSIPLDDVLGYGIPDARAARAYVRHLISAGSLADTAKSWDWAVAHAYTDSWLAGDYVNFLVSSSRYESAARTWARYAGDRTRDYLERTWVFNGDFEFDVASSCVFDWRINNLSAVKAMRETGIAHSGEWSLGIHFLGRADDVRYDIGQQAFVKPGEYRFEAFIRTHGVESDQAIGFHIFDPETHSRVDVKTPTVAGTTEWQKVEASFVVPPETSLIQIQMQSPVSRSGHKIRGSAWIDSVRLERRN